MDKIAFKPKEVAEMLGLCRPVVMELIHTGEIRSKKIDRNYLIPKDAVEEWLNSGNKNIRFVEGGRSFVKVR